MKRALHVFLLLLLVAVPPRVRAVAPEIKDKLSKVKVLPVNTDTKLKVWELAKGDSDFQVVDLKLGPRDFETELGNVVASWVKEGNGVLVYLSYPLENASSQVLFSYLPIKDAGTWERIKAEAYPEAHPVLNGVKTVEVWAHNYISFYKQPAMAQLEGWSVLLHQMIGTEDRIYAMAGPMGSGRAVIIAAYPFFPEYHGAVFDNERFLVNIYQWLAGSEVPEEILPLK